MKVAVLGAGIAGVTTAYYLAERGFEVVLVDRAGEVAAETSFANGAQLSYSYTDALGQPGFLRRVPSLLLGRDPAIRIALGGNASLMAWGREFLAECKAARAKDNTLAVLDLALASARLLGDLRARTGIRFDWRRPGKIAVIAEKGDVEQARRRVGWKQERGCNVRVIDYGEAVELEPALRSMVQRFAAAVYSPDDEVGDAHFFARELVRWLEATHALELRLGESVEAIEVRGGQVEAVRTGAGEIDVDAAVVCLGPWSQPLLDAHGIDTRILPVRGYSVTLPAGKTAPLVSITNIDKRIVYTRLGDRMRIAGFADFLGHDTRRDGRRLQRLVETARAIAPNAADYTAAAHHEWGGFRPVTPDSRPLVGRTYIRGLFLNTGHGVLGWTLACATGDLVARTVAETASDDAAW